jgi:glutamine cyclotransferase
MWVLDNSSAKIYKHKTDDVFSMVSEYDSPAMNPCGMFKLDDKFYIGDYKTGNIYTVSAKDFTISGVYSIPLFEKNDYKLAGLCSDGNNIWVASDGNGKIFKIPFSSLKSIKF